VRVRVLGYQYQQGSLVQPLITPDFALKKYRWSTSADGSLKSLTQTFEIHKGRNRVQLTASYDSRSGLTVIKGGDSPHTVMRGLVLLRMTTSSGDLKIEYDPTAPVSRKK
jgi:hypothetical protein